MFKIKKKEASLTCFARNIVTNANEI